MAINSFIQAKVIRQISITEQVIQVPNAAPAITLDASVDRLSLPVSTTPAFKIQLVPGLS